MVYNILSKEELCLVSPMFLEVDVTCIGRVRTDLAFESERGLPVWINKNVNQQSEKNITTSLNTTG